MTKFEFQTGDKVLARYDDEDKWELHHFSHKEGSEFSCDGWTCGQCIPYNETTKHLCGTSDPYIDPTDFEVGDTVSFRYTENTTGCGEIVGITGDTIQVSVFGGVYSVDRKCLTLVRRGEKKIKAPTKSHVFEFGDVVGVRFKTKRNMGIFITYSKRHKDFCVVAVKRENGEIGMFTKLLKNVEFLRKGNFND